MRALILTLTGFLVAASACTPQYPEEKARTSACQSDECTVDGAPAELYYQKFMSAAHGSCSDPSTMSFTYMEATSVLPNTADGFAAIRLYLKPDRTYRGSYVDPLGQFGLQNPLKKGPRQITHIEGHWYLTHDKIVIEGVGIGHKISDNEILVQPISSTKLPLQRPIQISFIAKQSAKNENGLTVSAVCKAN